MSLPAIVRVKWKDAYTKDAEFDQKTIETMDPFAETHTVGFLVRRTKDALYVAQDIAPDEMSGDQYRGVTVIPRGMILTVRELK